MTAEPLSEDVHLMSPHASVSSDDSGTLIPQWLHEPFDASNTSVAQAVSPSSAETSNRTSSPKAGKEKTSRHDATFPFFHRRRQSQPIGHVFLRAVGLKSFTENKKQRTWTGEEIRKAVVKKSRRLACAKLAVHLLPCTITVFLITFNAIGFVNGPDITTLSKYALQGASKLHELTIVGSLAAVVTDFLRYQLLRNGVDLGLLSSPFSFMGLNFLWSQELFSAVRSGFRLQTKLFFVLLLIAACVLAAVVGPASALLFLPSQAWQSTGSTEFYLAGSENDLWPQHLTANHTGPPECKDGSAYYCLNGGWSNLRGFVTPEGVDRRNVFLGDSRLPRNMWLWRPYYGGTDSYASTLHGATAYLAKDMDASHDHAWNFAKRFSRVRRLRDAILGYHIRVRGRMPVVRVLCGPFQNITLGIQPKLLFPILNETDYWRRDDGVGLVKELEVNVDVEHAERVNATWHLLSPDFGPTTVGLAYFTKNETNSVGCGCSVDARWAWGEANTHGQISTRVWQGIIGQPPLPVGISYSDPGQTQFFEDRIKQNLSPTITADKDWIHALVPDIIMEIFGASENVFFNPIEALLLHTRLWDIPWVQTDTIRPIRNLEALVSAYFVNAISRIGWAPQHDPNSEGVNPILRLNSRLDTDNLLHKNGEIYDRPANVSTSTLKMEWFSYTTAWQMDDPVLYVSVTVLILHMIIALFHTAFTVYNNEVSEAWDSITEIIVLAYNSLPRDGGIANCGAGIMLLKTFKENMKVLAIPDDSSSDAHKVQLVACTEESKQSQQHPNAMPVEANRQYG